ncbi:MAG: S9 family peptidase, partial [Bacteroidota bacterium]
MKKIRATVILFFLSCGILAQEKPKEIGNLVIDGIPDIPERIVERMNQYQNVRSAGFADWDPMGKGMLVSTRFAETSQLHYVEKPGGARTQITFFREPVAGGAFYPKTEKRQFIYTMDKGGAEFYQIYSFDMKDGKYEMLTDGKSRNTSGLWSHSGKQFAFSSTKRNGKDTDIYLMDMANRPMARLLLEVSGTWAAVDWSPDDSKLLVMNYISVNESYVFVADAKTGTKEQVNPVKDKKIAYGGAQWSKDGTGIYYTSDEYGEFQQLIYLEWGTKAKRKLPENINWDVSEFELSPNGSRIAFVTNEGGMSRLRLVDAKTRKEVSIEATPVGVVGGMKFNPSSTKLALTINS